MTAVVVLDGKYDMEQKVTLEPGIFVELYAQGASMAGLAKVNGKEYILVTAGADGNHETSQFHIEDAKVVYNRLE